MTPQKTMLSTKGQVIIPREIRSRHQWEPGQTLLAVDTEDGVILKTMSPFPESTLEETASCLSYSGKPKTIEEMEEAISKGARSMRHDRR